MISFDSISKSYGDLLVLDQLNLSIPLGKRTLIKGKSGIGKTTILRLLAGVEEADSGQISSFDLKLAFVFQEDRLIENMSVYNNLLMLDPSLTKTYLQAVLGKLDLNLDLKMKAKHLSGGMKRRVAIARALIRKPDLLILDEAFNGLDEKSKTKVAAFILEEMQGKTIVFVTHENLDANLLKAEKEIVIS